MYIYATISENRHTCNFHIARSGAPNTYPRACIRAVNSRIYSQSRVFRLIYFIIGGSSVAIYQNTNLNHSTEHSAAAAVHKDLQISREFLETIWDEKLWKGGGETDFLILKELFKSFFMEFGYVIRAVALGRLGLV